MVENIMLIDDNKIDLFVNQRIIEKYDSTIKTRVFNNAISAISFFKLLELNTNIKCLTIPDIILLDVSMPEMDGFKFLEEFKKINLVNKDKISIYMVSSSSCPDDIRNAQKEIYCSGYITKPLTVDKLKSVSHNSINFKNHEYFKKII
ncbi:response regulator [Psychroserpens mesophilus]|uniref:response regulator n=1 Tax=Psychroserpens mesophilus TaxID=325473 RepID=UPI003D65DB76